MPVIETLTFPQPELALTVSNFIRSFNSFIFSGNSCNDPTIEAMLPRFPNPLNMVSLRMGVAERFA